jgi:hypothetical protein
MAQYVALLRFQLPHLHTPAAWLPLCTATHHQLLPCNVHLGSNAAAGPRIGASRPTNERTQGCRGSMLHPSRSVPTAGPLIQCPTMVQHTTCTQMDMQGPDHNTCTVGECAACPAPPSQSVTRCSRVRHKCIGVTQLELARGSESAVGRCEAGVTRAWKSETALLHSGLVSARSRMAAGSAYR